MRVKYNEKIGIYTIIRFITDITWDPVKTGKKIKSMITPEMTEEDKKRLYMDNLEPADYGSEAEVIEDDEAEIIKQKLDSMGENKKLLDKDDNGDYEYIDDYRDTEYWIRLADAWTKEKVEEIGQTLPGGAILQENLTPEYQEEIRIQQEEERLAALTPKQRAEEGKRKIEAQLAKFDREYLTPRVLAGFVQGDTYSIEQVQLHEQYAIPLRAEWRRLDEQLSLLMS